MNMIGIYIISFLVICVWLALMYKICSNEFHRVLRLKHRSIMGVLSPKIFANLDRDIKYYLYCIQQQNNDHQEYIKNKYLKLDFAYLHIMGLDETFYIKANLLLNYVDFFKERRFYEKFSWLIRDQEVHQQYQENMKVYKIIKDFFFGYDIH